MPKESEITKTHSQINKQDGKQSKDRIWNKSSLRLKYWGGGRLKIYQKKKRQLSYDLTPRWDLRNKAEDHGRKEEKIKQD